MIHRLALLIALLPGIALAQNERVPEIPELSVEVILAGGDGSTVYVQQQVLLRITLVSRYPFKTLQIETPSIRDAEAHVAARAKTREFTSYVGSGWRHQRVTALFPLKSGPWEIPAITATGAVVWPDGTTRGFESRSSPRILEIAPAHPYLNGFWWVAAEDISLSEEWTRDLNGMKIGDTVRRTVRMTAKGVTADRLPEMSMVSTPGVSLHEAGDSETTRFSPDGAVTEVTRSWDITVNSEDPVNLAPVSVNWWHTGESRPASSGVPSARVEPLAVDAVQLRADLLAEAVAEQRAGFHVLLAMLVLLLVPAAALLFALLHAVLPTWADLRLRNQQGTVGMHEIVRWGQTSVDPSIRTVGDLEKLAPSVAADSLKALQTAAYGRKEEGRANRRELMRWARRMRLFRLRSSLSRMVARTLG